mmetsp:Transcript_14115/g.24740  ORF Transcript_14115/g.24740 Transcript_14115/m.24740 type:complete len:424 (-) Transcript_14115:70-1341(-)
MTERLQECHFEGIEGLPCNWESYFASLCKQWDANNKIPIVYHSSFNVSFLSRTLCTVQYQDSNKYGKIFRSLSSSGLIKEASIIEPLPIPDELLKLVHTEEYINQIQNSNMKIVQMTGMPYLLLFPNALLRWNIITPLKHHACGTVVACGLALKHGWSINLGGGFHHASASNGPAWCPYADIPIAISTVRHSTAGQIRKVLVIDLDALQGNGIAFEKLRHRHNTNQNIHDRNICKVDSGDPSPSHLSPSDQNVKPLSPSLFSSSNRSMSLLSSTSTTPSTAPPASLWDEDLDTCILDMYNGKAYPMDDISKEGIDVKVELKPHIEDEEYLSKLQGALVLSMERFGVPHFVVYLAGANILKGDDTGRLGLSAEGMRARDQMVWEFARKLHIPICMVLGGGFVRGAAEATANSIRSLLEGFRLLG